MDCEFNNLGDLLVDTIINGVKHKKVQERLLNKGQDLRLEKTIQIVLQFELSQQQLKEIRGEDVEMAAIKREKKGHKHSTRMSRPNSKESRLQKPKPLNSLPSVQRSRCGYDKAQRRTARKRPAIGSQCGHWLLQEAKPMAHRMQEEVIT